MNTVIVKESAIFYIVSVDHIRSGVWFVPWIAISASDTELGRTW